MCRLGTRGDFGALDPLTQDEPLPAELLARLRGERISDVVRRIPVAVAVNAVNASGTAWVLSQAEPAWPGPIIWLAVFAAVIAGRLLAWWVDRRGMLAPRQRTLLTFLGSLAAGLAWGLGTASLLPEAPTYQLFLAFVVGGMCAGSVTISAAHFPSLAAFVLSATVPLAVRFLYEGSQTSIPMGCMGLVFAVALMFTGRGFSASFGDRLLLQWELNQANRKLREEITEHQATEATLRQAQKLDAVGQLTAGIAHDFNNLLMVIAGQAEMLHAAGLPAETERRLSAIREATPRGSQLTRQLLAFGRRLHLQPRVVDLNALLGEMTDMLARTLGRDVDVSFAPSEGLWPVYVDADQIEHAILNLAINARDAMPGGGIVTVAAANIERPPNNLDADLVDGNYVRITVRDTGVGMPDEVLNRAFEPFFTTKTAGQGSGLGLSQVYGLVHQSGGTLRIDSRTGHGTTVEIYLPRAPQQVPRNS